MAFLYQYIPDEYLETGQLIPTINRLRIQALNGDEKTDLLRQWLDRVGREPEDWMFEVVVKAAPPRLPYIGAR